MFRADIVPLGYEFWGDWIMKCVQIEYIVKKGSFAKSAEWTRILAEIKKAIKAVVWPPENNCFNINPKKQGNGVVPIKEAFLLSLEKTGWNIKERGNALRLDAIKALPGQKLFGVEWETGNISSSHRAINRLLLGNFKHGLIGGVLIVPSRELYQYLTDRIGNFTELTPYLELWKSISGWSNGVLAIIVIEQDGVDSSVPLIKKGTDGNALFNRKLNK